MKQYVEAFSTSLYKDLSPAQQAFQPSLGADPQDGKLQDNLYRDLPKIIHKYFAIKKCHNENFLNKTSKN